MSFFPVLFVTLTGNVGVHVRPPQRLPASPHHAGVPGAYELFHLRCWAVPSSGKEWKVFADLLWWKKRNERPCYPLPRGKKHVPALQSDSWTYTLHIWQSINPNMKLIEDYSFTRNVEVDLFVCLEFYTPLENFSLIWRHQYYQWKAANFYPYLAVMAIEQ